MIQTFGSLMLMMKPYRDVLSSASLDSLAFFTWRLCAPPVC